MLENNLEQFVNSKSKANSVRILIVDDEPNSRRTQRLVIGTVEIQNPINIDEASSIREALSLLSSHRYNVIILDKTFKNGNGTEDDGIEHIADMKAHQPHLQILVVTGSSNFEDTERALKLGASGYMVKGMTPPSIMALQIKEAINNSINSIEKSQLERSQMQPDSNDEFVAVSPAMQSIYNSLCACAEVSHPVLLLGESGTGKGACAKMLNTLRKNFLKQKNRPFFNLNLSGLGESTIQSELFGHEEGAYTDANKMKLGFFELAHNGDIFLDEIGDLSLDMQAKILKVVEEKRFFRMDGTKEIKTNFRLITATNKNLLDMVDKKLFRHDLYMRIAVLPIEIPSLENRIEDIPDIMRVMINRFCQDASFKIEFDDLPKGLVEYVQNNLPVGNVRGIDAIIIRLLTNAPKDKSGKPILNSWKSIIKYESKQKSKSSNPNYLSYSDIVNTPYDVVNDKFPGLKEFLRIVEKNIIDDAKGKYKLKSEIARVLKTSNSSMTGKMRKT